MRNISFAGDNTMNNAIVNKAVRHARRIVVFVMGGTVLLVGIALIFLPGPAIAVIPIGLAILGTEFVWARRLLKKLRTTATDALASLRSPTDAGATDVAPSSGKQPPNTSDAASTGMKDP